MQVSTPLCGILIFHARQLADCACWRAVHLRGVNTFRSIETEFANFFFSFRDSDSPTAPTKGAHGGAPHATDVHRTPLSFSLLSLLLSLLSGRWLGTGMGVGSVGTQLFIWVFFNTKQPQETTELTAA